MTPAIADNAILLIAKDCDINNGEIGVFIVNDEAYVKRCMKKDKFVFLISDNTHYDPIIVTDNDEFVICGKAVRTVNEL